MPDHFKKAAFFKPRHVAGVKNNRIIELSPATDVPLQRGAYQHAQQLAAEIGGVTSRWKCILDGKFIFGDLIEAMIVNNNWLVRELWINTLSFDNNNVDSLENLLNGDFVQEMNVIISDYFYSHERSSLIRYAYDRLDKQNKFQLAACRTHMKTTLILVDDGTPEGRKIVIEGSANLRSSANIESVTVEECPVWFDVNRELMIGIVDRYKTINKSLKRDELWLAAQMAAQEKAI